MERIRIFHQPVVCPITMVVILKRNTYSKVIRQNQRILIQILQRQLRRKQPRIQIPMVLVKPMMM